MLTLQKFHIFKLSESTIEDLEPSVVQLTHENSTEGVEQVTYHFKREIGNLNVAHGLALLLRSGCDGHIKYAWYVKHLTTVFIHLLFFR